MHEGLTKITVVADDMGLDPAIDRAVVRAWFDGLISDANILTTSPRARTILQYLRSVKMRGLGLHLDLSEASHRPLSREPSPLVGADGHFLGQEAAFAVLAADDAALRAWLRRELRLQIEALLAEGMNLQHISGHHHVHLFPAVRETLVEVLSEFDGRKPVIRGYGKAIMPPASPMTNLIQAYGMEATLFYKGMGYPLTRAVGFRWMVQPKWHSLRIDLAAAASVVDAALPNETFAAFEWMVHLAIHKPGEKSLGLRREEEFVQLRDIRRDGLLSPDLWDVVACQSLQIKAG